MPSGGARKVDSIYKDKLKEVCNLPIGGVTYIDDYTWNSFRGTLNEYIKDKLIDIKLKTFLVDDKKRIIVRITGRDLKFERI